VFSEILRLVSDSHNLPILIHCAAGKDRTGFACSLIQLALGVPLELVVQDYLQSNDHLGQLRDDVLNRLKIFSILGVSRQKLFPLFEARREYIEAAFGQIEEDYPSLEDYIRQGLGLSDPDLLRLNDVLLEEVV
jgi:protein-tyrosine phosphatase